MKVISLLFQYYWNPYSGFKRFFLGSVTDRVLRAGQTPVLVVPTS